MSSSNTANVAIDDPLVAILTYPELLERQDYLQHRLTELAVPPPPPSTTNNNTKRSHHRTSSNVVVPYADKTDTHTDFLLKEMQWLSADFASERKRHHSLRRKLGASLRAHFASLESRRLKALADAELKRRRLAAKLGRDCVKAWWNKLDKIVTYKQKLSLEENRRRAMNQQLVKLVQRTEKYGRHWKQLHLQKGPQHLTVEQALALGKAQRRRKTHVKDYARLQFVEVEPTLYGESTEDSGSDASYEPSSSDEDESTLLQAEREERQRRGLAPSTATDGVGSFAADPIELQKLREEETMDLQLVLQRLRDEAPSETTDNDEEERTEAREDSEPAPKRVKFARSVQFNTASKQIDLASVATNSLDPGDDADDDGDASEVEDYNEDLGVDDENGSDEDDEEDFVAIENEVDDETTIAHEESLPQNVSAQEELQLLKADNELSIDQLRAKYAAALDATDSGGVTDDSPNNVKLETLHPASNDETIGEPPEDSEIESEGSDEDRTTRSSTSLMLQVEADDEDTEEFQPTNQEVDDETTMEAEERLGRDMSYEDEIALLKREGEMSIDEIRALYARNDQSSAEEMDDETDVSQPSRVDERSYFDNVHDQENDEEFLPSEEERDDERTIEAEERLGREITVEEEISLLQKEGSEPIEALRNRYRMLSSASKRKRESDDEDTDSDASCVRNASESETGNSASGRAALRTLEETAEQARTAKASRPFLLSPSVKLREYQQGGLDWLVALQSQRLNGVLADEMGLGKTLQTIALLAYLACYQGIWGPHLIVVPTSVILNWENELKRFAPALKVLCYYGPAKRRKELRSGWTKSNWYHVVITSYQLAVQDAFAFKRKKWYYLVLDEAQNIKNFQSQRWQTLINFNTQRRLLLTGTPLQNSLMELWSLLHFLMPHVFRSRKQFSYWFANPMSSIIEGSGQSDDVLNRLHGIIRPFVLRRLKKDVEAQMPGKFEHIIKCQLSRRQMFIYEEFLARSSTRQSLKKGGNFLGMMNVLMQLRKVCNHPDLFEPRSVVTPFVTDALRVTAPSCIVFVENQVLHDKCLSLSLRCPLWCGSSGLPSLDAALRHDVSESDELLLLEEYLQDQADDMAHVDIFGSSESRYPPALQALLDSLNEQERKDQQRRVGFLHELNSRRCKASPFPFSQRFLRLTRIKGVKDSSDPHAVVSTPAGLLALQRNMQDRADSVDDLISHFVFCVPRAGAECPILDITSRNPQMWMHDAINEKLREPTIDALRPFRKAQARLSSFFPDRKLVQFDAGKLQTLAELLRELKRGSHRALIFTQMSKMLDILEAFLNLNGHTYLRLDGSTGVERRQRLMDRFNNDPKVFCFILSTRSGGLGINLTGADTVIFYDQDWNPAMDAQAQDRAHRIGQTREVHIYRLVTEHTIEENILVKAQQKRNLDILVMDQGNFDASQLFGHGSDARTSKQDDSKSVYTKGGLRSILGLGVDENSSDNEMDEEGMGHLDVTMEKAMTSLEDADDVQALRGAQKEAAEELKEFDDNGEVKKSSDSEDDDDDDNHDLANEEGCKPTLSVSDKESLAVDKPKATEEEELEKEFAAWQDQVGFDAATIEASLSPTERYGLKFREQIDPYISIFAVQEQRRKLEAEAEVDDEVDIDEIERQKALEEQQAFDDGDLLCTRPRPEDLVRQRDLYFRERARLRSNKKRLKLTGENWEVRQDALSKHPFWYNVDTGEAIWDKPSVLVELEAYELAERELYSALPIKPLIRVMSFLSPVPDRNNCALVCHQWRAAARDPSFVLHVYPVELEAYARDEAKMEYNHYRNIADAVTVAQPGDTIELGDGHYWVNCDLVVNRPLRFVGDDNNAANVVVEMGGSLVWRASRGLCEGVTLRRPKLSSGLSGAVPLIRLESSGRLNLLESTLDNDGGSGPAVIGVGSGRKGRWERVLVRGGKGGVSLADSASLELVRCKIKETGDFGIFCQTNSDAKLTRCHIQDVAGTGAMAESASTIRLLKCHVSMVPGGKILTKEFGASISCSGNTATPSSLVSPIPGFRPAEKDTVDDVQ